MPRTAIHIGRARRVVVGGQVGHVDAAGKTRGVQVVDSLAYVANGYAGLRILDLSDPRNPTELGHLKTYRALDVRVAGPTAFVADDYLGLLAVDVSDPARPRALSRHDTPGEAQTLTLAGKRAYVADGAGGLRVIDVSNPRRLKEATFFDIKSL